MRDLEKFWEKVQEKFFIDEAPELEYNEFLEIGEECGLLTTEPFDPKKHDGVVGAEDMEPGDPVYVPVPRVHSCCGCTCTVCETGHKAAIHTVECVTAFCDRTRLTI